LCASGIEASRTIVAGAVGVLLHQLLEHSSAASVLRIIRTMPTTAMKKRIRPSFVRRHVLLRLAAVSSCFLCLACKYCTNTYVWLVIWTNNSSTIFSSNRISPSIDRSLVLLLLISNRTEIFVERSRIVFFEVVQERCSNRFVSSRRFGTIK